MNSKQRDMDDKVDDDYEYRDDIFNDGLGNQNFNMFQRDSTFVDKNINIPKRIHNDSPINIPSTKCNSK